MSLAEQFTATIDITRPPLVAVAITVHNRRNTTLRCLKTVSALAGEGVTFRTKVFLVDDGSSDGTAQAVQQDFPHVHLQSGDGSLFWGGGMHLAMTAALASDPDFVLLLNDDVEVHESALVQTLADYNEAVSKSGNPRQVIVGAVTDPKTGALSYSGFARTSSIDPSKLVRLPNSPDALQTCDTMNGNFVLVTKALTQVLGPVDSTFTHQLGDLDYGYRAKAAGGQLWISRDPVGTCAPNNRLPPYRKPGLDLVARWRALNSPLGLPLRPWLTFMWRWGGLYGLAKLAGMYLLRMIGR